ncbi:hypothetical protein Anapl_04652 [Anas platyrhynchos]|uniref:Uncharacterized protein n=1 Tax=Anas platyrhynchos TaxID=8839 RepID=R0K246_ANAPL|nr:hypothetical protein Anapl_04652 [Anas platyrhynchos]
MRPDSGHKQHFDIEIGAPVIALLQFPPSWYNPTRPLQTEEMVKDELKLLNPDNHNKEAMPAEGLVPMPTSQCQGFSSPRLPPISMG